MNILIANSKTKINYTKVNHFSKIKYKFNTLAIVLTFLFKLPVVLNCTPIKYPYLDSTILAKYLSLNTSFYNFQKLVKLLFNKTSINNKSILKINTLKKLHLQLKLKINTLHHLQLIIIVVSILECKYVIIIN